MRSVGMTVALSRGTVMCPQCGGATVLIIRSGERARTAVSRFGCVTAVSIWMRVGVHRATAFLSTASSTVHARWIGAPRESRAASGEASAGAASHGSRSARASVRSLRRGVSRSTETQCHTFDHT